MGLKKFIDPPEFLKVVENVARTIIYYITTIIIIVKFSNTTPLPLMIWGGLKA